MIMVWEKVPGSDQEYRAPHPAGGQWCITPVRGGYGPTPQSPHRIDYWALWHLRGEDDNPEEPVSRHSSLKKAKGAAERTS